MIALPLSPDQFLELILEPALTLLPDKMASKEAKLSVLAICLQESGLRTRQQVGGPAHGFPQFELNGVLGVLTHSATRAYALEVCAARGVAPTPEAVYGAILYDDILAAAFARLLLWSDPYPLPAIGDDVGAWLLYVRTWRPGQPHRDRWTFNYTRAREALGA